MFFRLIAALLLTIFLLSGTTAGSCVCDEDFDASSSISASFLAGGGQADLCTECGHKRSCCSYNRSVPAPSSNSEYSIPDNIFAQIPTAIEHTLLVMSANRTQILCPPGTQRRTEGTKVYLLNRALLI